MTKHYRFILRLTIFDTASFFRHKTRLKREEDSQGEEIIKVLFSLFNYYIDSTIHLNGSNFCRKNQLVKGNVKPNIIFVILRPWDCLIAKNLSYKTYVYQTIIQYCRKNSSKVLKHQIEFLLPVFF